MNIYMAKKGLNCGINKTVIMVTKITVSDIGDFNNVEIIEILVKSRDIIKKYEKILPEIEKIIKGTESTIIKKNYLKESMEKNFAYELAV